MSRRFVVGDIHGGAMALSDVLGKSNFDFDKDKLICLGDVADGWSEVPECIDILLKIKNLIYIKGNHDVWMDDWLQNGSSPMVWTEQGGRATIYAYVNRRPECMVLHRDFFKDNAKLYHVEDNMLFVHGGFDPSVPVEKQSETYLTWDRKLWDNKEKWDKNKCGDYDQIFVGHTPIQSYSDKPININNIWFMDTGAGCGCHSRGLDGKLSLMDIDTKELFQSDLGSSYYKID